jgi:hypothetical protein
MYVYNNVLKNIIVEYFEQLVLMQQVMLWFSAYQLPVW